MSFYCSERKFGRMEQLKLIVMALLIFMLIGCSSNVNEGSTDDEENISIGKSVEDKVNDLNEADRNDQHTIHDDSNDISSEENEDSVEKNNDPLAAYSSEQIEYARIWLQLGPNQEIDELNIRQITASETVHSSDETNVKYPEAE